MNKRKNSGRPYHGHRNPKRGPPGILLFCETGRERKCYNEALEILNHYYQTCEEERHQEAGNDNNKQEKKPMSLEEEIQMMKQEKKKAPFQEYDTGCKGVVFIMFTAKHCKNIVAEAIAINEDGKDQSKEKIAATKVETLVTEDAVAARKRRHEENDDLHVQHKKLKGESSSISSSSKITCTEKLWDPIETVHSVIKNIQKNDSMAPRSRFIIKMIPIQATCYANMEEMEPTVKALLQTYLVPLGVEQFYSNRKKGTESQAHQGTKESSNNDSNLPSFKVDIRRRFCSHLKRDDVIALVANTVQSLTSDFWQSLQGDKEGVSDDISKKEEAGTERDEEEKEQSSSRDEKRNETNLFSVDLTAPDYTIVIEICRTLCTMSVVKDMNSLQQFNLIKIQEDAVGSNTVE